MSPIAELPTTRKDVPWKAVRTRKMKYEGRFGARAVPMLNAKKRKALARKIYHNIP
jgi:hypothetical protein